jgi:hypothetical protein
MSLMAKIFVLSYLEESYLPVTKHIVTRSLESTIKNIKHKGNVEDNAFGKGRRIKFGHI